MGARQTCQKACSNCTADCTRPTPGYGDEFDDERPGGDPAGATFEETLEDLNSLDRHLMLFCATSNLSAVRWLLRLGAHPDACDANGTTCLHVACRSGAIAIVKEMMGYRELLEAIDQAGWTALHISVLMGRREVVCMLIQAGAPLTKRNGKGQMPAELCSDSGTLEALRAYEQHQAQSPGKPFEFQKTFDAGEDSVGSRLQYEPFFVPRQPVIRSQQYKKEFQKLGMLMFNRQPGYGLAFLVASGVARDYPVDMSTFLRRTKVDIKQVGSFLGEAFSLSHTIRLEFINSVVLQNTGVVSALVQVFRMLMLPDDLQKINRLVHGVSRIWWRQHERMVKDLHGDVVPPMPMGGKGGKGASMHHPVSPEPFIDESRLLGFCGKWGLNQDAQMRLFKLPAEIQQIVITNFHPSPGSQAEVSAKFMTYAASVEKSKAQQELVGLDLKQYLTSSDALHQLMFSTVLLHWFIYKDGVGPRQEMDYGVWRKMNEGIEAGGSNVPEHVQLSVYQLICKAFVPELAVATSSRQQQHEQAAGHEEMHGGPVDEHGHGGSVASERPKSSFLCQIAALEGWAQIVGGGFPKPTGLMGVQTVTYKHFSNIFSEVTTSSGFKGVGASARASGDPNLGNPAAAMSPGLEAFASGPRSHGKDDFAWLSICYTLLFFSANPALGSPYAFVELQKVSVLNVNHEARILTIVGAPDPEEADGGGHAELASAAPSANGTHSAGGTGSDSGAGAKGNMPVVIVLLLPDGRWQELPLQKLELRMPNVAELNQWSTHLMAACQGKIQRPTPTPQNSMKPPNAVNAGMKGGVKAM